MAEELATKHRGFYSDKKSNTVAGFFLGHIYRGLRGSSPTVDGRGQLIPDRRCLNEVPAVHPDTSPTPTTTRRPPPATTSTARLATALGLGIQLMPRLTRTTQQANWTRTTQQANLDGALPCVLPSPAPLRGGETKKNLGAVVICELGL